MTRAEQWALGPLTQIEASCIVPPDESSVVRHARPTTDADRAAMHEQAIAMMRRDPAAVQSREMRIALSRPNVTRFRRRA